MYEQLWKITVNIYCELAINMQNFHYFLKLLILDAGKLLLHIYIVCFMIQWYSIKTWNFQQINIRRTPKDTIQEDDTILKIYSHRRKLQGMWQAGNTAHWATVHCWLHRLKSAQRHSIKQWIGPVFFSSVQDYLVFTSNISFMPIFF